jgi:hypothetical protein
MSHHRNTISNHRKTGLSEDDQFNRAQTTVFAVLVAIAAVAGLLRVVGVMN